MKRIIILAVLSTACIVGTQNLSAMEQKHARPQQQQAAGQQVHVPAAAAAAAQAAREKAGEKQQAAGDQQKKVEMLFQQVQAELKYLSEQKAVADTGTNMGSGEEVDVNVYEVTMNNAPCFFKLVQAVQQGLGKKPPTDKLFLGDKYPASGFGTIFKAWLSENYTKFSVVMGRQCFKIYDYINFLTQVQSLDGLVHLLIQNHGAPFRAAYEWAKWNLIWLGAIVVEGYLTGTVETTAHHAAMIFESTSFAYETFKGIWQNCQVLNRIYNQIVNNIDSFFDPSKQS